MDKVPLALPRKMLPTPEGALSPNTNSQWVKILPNNVSSITSSTATVSSSTSVPTQVTLGAQAINFDIPSGGPDSFIDTAKTSVSFRVRYQVTTLATTAYTGVNAFLQASAHSYINRMTTFVSGQVVDDVAGYDLAVSADELNWALDVAQRDCNGLQLGLLQEDDTASSQNKIQGHAIAAWGNGTTLAATTSSYYSYEIPLYNSFIGILNKSMLPIGRCGKVQLQLYTPQLLPVTILSTAGTGAGAVIQATIDNISLNVFQINLDKESASILPKMPVWTMHAETHRVGFGAINSGTSGSVSVQVPIRAMSVNRLATRFSENVISTAGSVNGQYDSKMPLCSSINYFLNGQKRVPPVPHNSLFGAATLYARAMLAYYDGEYDFNRARSGIVANPYLQYLATGSAPTVTTAEQLTVSAASTSDASCMSAFVFSEDLRVTSTSTFLAGQDLSNGNSFLELNISNAPSNSVNVAFIARCDILFQINPDGSVSFRV
jgi:hypothetical protein